jgi:Cdc6-like AAA superfamily ATPase
MRDVQLLFEPYSEEQITTIIEEKVNLKFQKFPLRIKQNQDVKKIFFSLLDAKNSFGFISKKISKMYEVVTAGD